MGQLKAVNQLSKFLAYVLGRQPDEFGLVPDADGFVRIKDLLKALSAETGWKHVRQLHLNELMVLLPAPGIEISDNLVRASDRGRLPKPSTTEHPPKLLYTCVRQKAYPRIVDKGLFASAPPGIVLYADRERAARIGRRIDAKPVLLTVQVQKAADRGVLFSKSGEFIYLTRSIPADCISGPSLPKQPREPEKKPVPKTPAAAPHAGSYFIDLNKPEDAAHPPRAKKKKNAIPWKKERRKANRKKRNPQSF